MKKVIFTFLLILIATATLGTYVVLNRSSKPMSEAEKEAALAKLLGRPVILDKANTNVPDTEYKGKYITFKYPSSATIYKLKSQQQLNDKADLEDFIFFLDNPRINSFVEVIQPASNVQSVTDYPSVRLRQIQSQTYLQDTVTADNQSGLSFYKADSAGFEKDAFFFLDGRIYSFSVQGNNSGGVENMFNKIISTLKFL